jgi:hypothetical protein
MKEIRTRAFIGIVGLAVAGLTSIGCGSGNESTGGAGSTGSAGTGAGGSTGNAGSSGNAGMSGGCAAPSAPLINDFSGAGGLSMGTPYVFQQSPLMAPVATVTAGALKVTFNTGAPTMMYPYAGWGIPLDACVNASSYTGVKFNISGTLNTGCTIQFSLGDKQHSDSPPLGTCTGSCYPGAKIFTLPSTATDMTVLFSEIGAGSPASPIVVPAEAIGVQWQLNVPTDGCMGEVTIDNVTFM